MLMLLRNTLYCTIPAMTMMMTYTRCQYIIIAAKSQYNYEGV